MGSQVTGGLEIPDPCYTHPNPSIGGVQWFLGTVFFSTLSIPNLECGTQFWLLFSFPWKLKLLFKDAFLGRVCQTCFRFLHETDIGCTKKKSPFFAPRLCLEFRDNFKTAIPKLSNAQLLSTVRTDEKIWVSQCLLPYSGQRLHTLRNTQILQCFFCPAKKQFRTHTHTCFAACLMIRFFWLKIWVTVRMGCQWIQKEILGPLDT